MKNLRHILIVTALVIIATVGLRFVFRYIFSLPRAASAEAQPIDTMFNIHFWMIAFLFSLIMVFMLYSAFVFRKQPEDETDGPHIHSNTPLEIGWTIVPVFVVIGFGIYGAVVLNEITRPDPNEMVVEVTGKQWVWSFGYPNEEKNVTSAELVLPVDQPVVLKMNSVDVLHSFWVPEFRVKQDLVPGRETTLRITPTQLGDYKVRCAEICGTNHSVMLADVRVLSAEDYQAWMEEKLAAPAFGEMTPEERGDFWHSAEGFGCVACHSTDGSAGVGPTWQGLYLHEVELSDGSTVTVDDEYIHNSIMDPNSQIVAGFTENLMPQDYSDQFAAKEAEILASEGVEIDIVADLIAFIKTLE
ncbi:MAG: cytochrome c oxidase subunit II [Chloroflexota bacterium]